MAPLEREDNISSALDEILKKADGLTELLCQTDSYRKYQRCLAALKEQPEVYEKVNHFRMENIQVQISDDDEDYYEKTEKLQAKYKNILMESVVMDFLSSEQRVCKMMRAVYDRIAAGLSLDVSYMDEETE